MKNDQFIDAVQTVGIITIALVLSYVVVRLEGTVLRAADRLNKVLIHQNEIIEATNRIGRRIETIEAVLRANKAAIEALSNRHDGKRHEGSSVDH
jgi:CHASE1-domain containing sensor protein